MSFRMRVLALVAVVAATAVAVTAWITYVQANREVTRQVAADERTSGEVLRELVAYANAHAGWDGVAAAAGALAEGTGQRIRLVADDGGVLVDTGTGPGGATPPVTVAPIVVDARPTLYLPPTAADPDAVTLEAIAAYRKGIRTVACLSEQGLDSALDVGPHGVPVYTASEETRRANPELVTRCLTERKSPEELDADLGAVRGCRGEPAPLDCLQRAFVARTSDLAPGVLRLYLVAEEGAPAPIDRAPIAAAAVVVVVLALAGTALLSRRVLRPIADVTAASVSLGEGDLGRRVPVRGRDELAQLARSFNRMADSVQSSEERQRRLVADVAHELRTPLANLRGYLEALKDGVLPGDQQLFADLHREAVLQQRIVDDLQDLALAEAGTLVYHPVAVDLAELLETCRTAHQTAADHAGVTLAVRVEEPPVVAADPDRLRQVIGNLVTNALRATPAGGSVTLTAGADPGGPARLTVADTGHGIATEDLPHIFDRFWRADAARSRGTGGSGLGLAIARQIVLDHGGTIAADSELGAGTTVTLHLPAPGS
jgi:two-component system sensor histidine kinase BaeS